MKIGAITAEQALRECEVFSTLNNAELEKIASSSLEKRYDAGTTIMQEGEGAQELLVIREGKVALQIVMPKASGQMSRRLTVDILGKNEILSWSAIVEPYIYTVSAVCLQKVNALCLSGTKLRWLLQDDPKIGYKVLQGLIKVVASRFYENIHVLASERLEGSVRKGLIKAID